MIQKYKTNPMGTLRLFMIF